MEHISVKKKIDRVIISHKIEKNEQINTMVLDIINKQEIPRLLPVQIRKALTGKKLRFVVQNYNDLRSLLKSDLEFGKFADIVLQIIETLQACESHGIPNGNLELNCDLTFFDYSKNKIYMVCWPLISLSAYAKVAAYFMDLGSIYTSMREDQEYRLRYLKFFDSRAKFDLPAFKTHVEALKKKWLDEQQKVPAPKPPVQGPVRQARIRRVSTGTMIEVGRYPFSIGRIAGYCDYAIENNRFIGKNHVTILLKDGKHYIRDNGSVNRTELNGTLLPANVEKELHSGATFRLANEDFIFYGDGG